MQDCYCNETGPPNTRATVNPDAKSVADSRRKSIAKYACRRDRGRHSPVGYRKPLKADSQALSNLWFLPQVEFPNFVLFEQGHDVSQACYFPAGYFILEPVTSARTAKDC